jgi:hypothetical protein
VKEEFSMASFKTDLYPLFHRACTADPQGSHMEDILQIDDYQTAKDNADEIKESISGTHMPPPGWVSDGPGLQPEYADHTWAGQNDPARVKLRADFDAWITARFPP